MLPINAGNIRDALVAAAIGWLICGATPAFGQLAVTDPPTEQATAQTAAELQQTNQILSQDLRANAATAQSVTALGGAGMWQPEGSYLANLNMNLNQGVSTTAAFTNTFPGWVPLPAHAISLSKALTDVTLGTYAGGFAIARQHLIDLPGRDAELAGIQQENEQVPAVLPALRLLNRNVLALTQSNERIEQLLGTLVIVETVDHGENLQERAHVGAQTARSLNQGVEP
jgi:hypothetical protein